MKIQKLSPRLATQLDRVAPEQGLPIIVRLKPDHRQIKALSLDFPLQKIFNLIPAASLHATQQEIDRLTDNPAVEMIWWDCPVHACLDDSVPLLGAPGLWRSGLNDSGVVVAIIDTGIDLNHPDLRGKIVLTYDSLGSAGSSDGSDPLSLACDAAVRTGVVVCAAAGNEGPGRGNVGSPGSAREVITVGASTDRDDVADFRSRGPTADERVKPDVVFPGYSIISLRAKGTSMGRVVDNHYVEASGTSMATPHASGAVALLLQARPDLPPLQIKQLLRATAKSLVLPLNTQGAGRADLTAAHRLALSLKPEPPPAVPPPTIPDSPGCLVAPLRSFGLTKTIRP